MGPSYFPLRDGVTWDYAVTDPGSCRLVRVRVRPPVEVEVEDMSTHETRRDRAWVLQEEGRGRPHFAVGREHGVQLLERSRFGKPEREAIVVTEDLRWAGAANWSRPHWHYGPEIVQYRRAGEEDVTVTAGVFRCLKIVLDEGRRGTFWLAPGVGIVRSVGAIEGLDPTRYLVLELLGFALP